MYRYTMAASNTCCKKNCLPAPKFPTQRALLCWQATTIRWQSQLTGSYPLLLCNLDALHAVCRYNLQEILTLGQRRCVDCASIATCGQEAYATFGVEQTIRLEAWSCERHLVGPHTHINIHSRLANRLDGGKLTRTLGSIYIIYPLAELI